MVVGAVVAVSIWVPVVIEERKERKLRIARKARQKPKPTVRQSRQQPTETTHTEWLSRPRALHLIRESQYFQFLRERTRDQWGSELAQLMRRVYDDNDRRRDRKYIPVELLRQFAADCPNAVRNESYERAALEGWLQDELKRKLGL